MKRLLLALAPAASVVLLAACSPSGANSTFALVGVPPQNSHVDSANFLISGSTCNYYLYRGDGTNPPEAAKGCTVMEDKSNSVGHPHALVKIGFATPKGEQVLTLTQSGNNSLTATSMPDIGMYLPPDWTVAAAAPDITLESSAAGSAYSSLAVHVVGVRCALTLTPASGGAPTSMPCGLVYWNSGTISIAVPGSLVSSESAGQSWTMHFARSGTSSGVWTLAKPTWGFPPSFSEAASTSK